MQTPVICLWYDNDADDAADLYKTVIGAKELTRTYYRGALAAEISKKPDGSLLTVELDIAGIRVQLLNGGPGFPFTEATTIVLQCDDQAEIDRIWAGILDAGGEEGPCGWIKDRFGCSWQIVPAELDGWMADEDPARVERVMNSFLTVQGKLDYEAIRAAYEGSDA